MNKTRSGLSVVAGGSGPQGGRVFLFSCGLLILLASPAPAARPVEAPEPQRLSAVGASELRGIVAAGSLEILQNPDFKEYRSEIDEFYRAGGYTMAWVSNSRPTAKARIVIKRLQAADNEGLLAQDYDNPLWKERLAGLARRGRPASESQLLRFDLALTICALRYILDLHLGRINPRPFQPEADFEQDARGPSDFLRKKVVSAQDISASFSALEPPFPSYRRLVLAVQRYRKLASRDKWSALPTAGLPVKPGDSYAGVARLRSLLRLLGDLPPRTPSRSKKYSGPLVKAVKRFQLRHGLPPDGILGEETLRQLNTPLERRLEQLRLALERWRWLPHKFSRPPILVNIPEFRLYAGSEPAQKVVVGMAFEHETPVFTSDITEVVFRPPWNVPMSIQLSEMVPELEKNPAYLEERDFEVLDARDAVVSSGAVSAEMLGLLRESKLYLRQRPGAGNSLGLVKFQMPNSHSVYIHGSPSRRGFRVSQRDLSHGCIRVENPGALAAWVLRDRPEWTLTRIRAAMEGTETITVKLAEPVPVLVQYGTVVAEEGGRILFFDDIYKRDEAEALAFEERSRAAAR